MKHHRHGITLAETVVSTLIVGLVLVSTIQIVGPIIRSGSVMADKAIAANLANELSEEIGSKLFQEPAAADVDSLGADFGETRSTYDDIDDYQGMTNTPPQLSDSTKLTNLANWSRVVRIDHVSVNDPSAQSAVYTGLKRVTVTVNKNGVELASIISLHAHAADQIGFVIEGD